MSQSNTSTIPFQERPTDDHPDISVIIVSWNVRDLLVKCLDALLSPGVAEGLRAGVVLAGETIDSGAAAAKLDAFVKATNNV